DKGDDVNSLAAFTGMSVESAAAIFHDQRNWDGGTVTEGLTDVAGHVLDYSLGERDEVSEIDFADMVSNFQIDLEFTVGLQAAFEGEIMGAKGGVEGNLASLTIAKATYQQQESDYGPEDFDLFFLYD